MSSKNNPGAFRCYEAALPDEHIFIILARDPAGPATLRFWADERERVGKTINPDDRDRIVDARRDADLMHEWREANLDPMGDGSGPTWKLVRITDDDGGPVRSLPENVTYVPAERDGDEAVRVSVEWLRRMGQQLTTGQITREFFAELLETACRSPQRSREAVVPVEEAAADAAKRDARAISLMSTVTTAIEQIDSMIEGGSVPSYSQIEDVRRTLFNGLGNQPIRGEYVDDNGMIRTTTLEHTYLGDKTVEDCRDRFDNIENFRGDYPIPHLRPDAKLSDRTQPSSARPPVVDEAPNDLAHAPEVPPHRFTSFHKGERYAYARGLEIAPIHLPICLDEMARDGWDLLAIFGQTDSKHIGFIFQRPQPAPLSALEIVHGFGAPPPADRDPTGRMARFLDGEKLDEIDGPCGAGGMGRGLEP